MTPHEIFARMTAAQAATIFSHLFEKEKPLYKATIDTLAKQRKLRPVFIERKPRAERFAWMHEAVGRAVNDSVAAHLLQIWLVGSQSAMLCDFLDGLGIKHDENGTIEQLPEAPSREILEKVIDSLMTKYDPGLVAIYLHAFQALDEKGWVSLAEILGSDARLRL